MTPDDTLHGDASEVNYQPTPRDRARIDAAWRERELRALEAARREQENFRSGAWLGVLLVLASTISVLWTVIIVWSGLWK